MYILGISRLLVFQDHRSRIYEFFLPLVLTMVWDVFEDSSKKLKIPVEKIREMVRNGEDMEKIAEAGNW